MYGMNNRKYGYQEKNQNYSPSSSYNYNPVKRNGNTATTNNHTGQRKRNDNGRYQRPNHFDKMVKQNDQIIRLLKEIRNRLPKIELDNESHQEHSQAIPENVYEMRNVYDDVGNFNIEEEAHVTVGDHQGE